MDTEALVWYSLLLVVLICLVSLVIIAAHGLWLILSRRFQESRLSRGRGALMALVTADEIRVEDVAPLRTLPAYAQDRIVLELARSFRGSVRGQLRLLAVHLGAVQRAITLTQSRFWWRRLRGAQMLTAVGGEPAAMIPLLRDADWDVRQQAIEWAGDHPSPGVISVLLDLLAEPHARSRFAILDALARLGPAVVEPLASYLEATSSPQVRSALEIATARPQAQYAAPALRLCHHPVPGIRACAAELLGATGGAEGVQVLLELLSDSDAGVRAAASSGLGRIGHWPAAPDIARMLRDSHWDVRRNAGFALRKLGSPGLLLLRRALTDEDRFAADMARLVFARSTGVEQMA
jgi:HEAT repeat protein